MEFIKRIVDAQPAELTAPAEPLEVVTEPDADHLRQLEKDKAYMQQWQAGPSPAYERPKQTHDCSLPAPTEPINEKLRRIRKTLHIPLGFFSYFESKPKAIMERSIDYAFLGSIGYAERFRNWMHYLMTPPKILSRNQMLAAFQKVSDRFKGKVYTTGDFFESIEYQAPYEEALADTKISVCPRGTSYETFRFFESCKAGCVVICEALPDVWYYKNHPAIILKDWSKLSSLIENLLNDEEMMKTKSAKSLMYWNTICEQNLAVRIAGFVESIENRVALSHLSQIDPEIPSQASHRSFG
jgi:hypothetical protein